MPTTVFKTQVESFLRRIGEGSYNIDLTNLAATDSQLKRYKLSIVYDYFFLAGQIVHRLVTKNPQIIKKTFPSLVKRSGAISTPFDIPSDCYYIFDKALFTFNPAVETTITKLDAVRIPEELVTLVEQAVQSNLTTNRYYPAVGKFYIVGNTIKPLYKSFAVTSVDIEYIKRIDRIELSNTDNDIWGTSVSDMLVDGAIAYAQGDKNETELESFFISKLNSQFQLKLQPIINVKGEFT